MAVDAKHQLALATTVLESEGLFSGDERTEALRLCALPVAALKAVRRLSLANRGGHGCGPLVADRTGGVRAMPSPGSATMAPQ